MLYIQVSFLWFSVIHRFDGQNELRKGGDGWPLTYCALVIVATSG